MLIFGWIGFNPGSALLLPTAAGTNKGFIAGHAAVTTVLAAAAGTLSSLLINGLLSYRRTGEFDFDVYVAMNGWYVFFKCILFVLHLCTSNSLIFIALIFSIAFLLNEVSQV